MGVRRWSSRLSDPCSQCGTVSVSIRKGVWSEKPCTTPHMLTIWWSSVATSQGAAEYHSYVVSDNAVSRCPPLRLKKKNMFTLPVNGIMYSANKGEYHHTLNKRKQEVRAPTAGNEKEVKMLFPGRKFLKQYQKWLYECCLVNDHSSYLLFSLTPKFFGLKWFNKDSQCNKTKPFCFVYFMNHFTPLASNPASNQPVSGRKGNKNDCLFAWLECMYFNQN